MAFVNHTKFVLVGFTVGPQTQTGIFVIFLLVYSLTLIVNMAIAAAVWLDEHLHSPMYYFLSSLALLDICFISSTVPKLLNILASNDKSISLAGCFVQFYFYVSLGAIEFYLLAVMSVDRYMAICNPLRYHSIMTSTTCFWLVLISWIGGFFTFIYPTRLMFGLSFCDSYKINHFFCDSSAVSKISCSNAYVFDLVFTIFISAVILGPLAISLISYCNILYTIMNMTSSSGRKKAFSTLTSHFTVVSLVYGSAMFIYVRPVDSSSLDVNKMVALLNSVVTPMLNPFIYSLRNKQVQDVINNIKLKLCLRSHS